MNNLATRNDAPGHLAAPMAPMSLPDLFKLGEMLVTTGFLAKAVDTPAKAVAIMLKGQELGIPPMYALNNIAVVNGKTVCQAELMLSLIYRDHGSRALEILETNDRVCRVRYQRRGGQPGELAFTIEEADAAGLLNKPGPPGGVAPWKGYRPAMLRARVISAAARIAFPDTIAGMYTPEEMGARVVVTSDGAVVMDEEQPPMLEPAASIARSYDGESIRPAMAAPVQEPAATVPTCAECEAELTETRFRDGTVWPPEQLAGYGRRKHDRVLCMEHYRLANEARRRAERVVDDGPRSTDGVVAPPRQSPEPPGADDDLLSLHVQRREAIESAPDQGALDLYWFDVQRDAEMLGEQRVAILRQAYTKRQVELQQPRGGKR